MATTAPTTTDSTAAAPKAKTVMDDMPSRLLFNTVDEATAWIAKASAELVDFASYPVVTVGFVDDNFDPEVYNDSMQVAIAKLTEKGSKEKNTESTIKSLVIYPTPNPAAVIADPAAADWLAGIIAKEANLVAMRPLRKATSGDELLEAQESMPRTLAEYMTSGRETSSGIIETYNQLWQLIKKAMGERFKAFGLFNLSKKELRKAMESASYAATVYSKLELRQNKAGEPDSYFEKAIKLGQALAKAESLDPTIFDRMAETRHQKDIEVATDDEGDEDSWDLDAIAAKLTEKPADSTDDASTEEAAPTA